MPRSLGALAQSRKTLGFRETSNNAALRRYATHETRTDTLTAPVMATGRPCLAISRAGGKSTR